MRKQILTVLLLLFGLIPAKADYQNAVIRDIWGGEKLVPFVFLNNLTFSDTSMTVNYIGDSTKVYQMANLEKIYFRTTTSGVNNKSDENKYSVYPNPSSDYISITTPDEYPLTAAIYGVTGKCFVSQILISANDRIDISSLTAGAYLIKLNNKIIKFEKYEN